MWFLVLIIFIFLMSLYFKFFKVPKLGNVVLVTGGVKAGKSTLSVHLVLKTYKKFLRSYYVKKFFLTFFNKKKAGKMEKPLIYSNVPLKVDFVPLTEDLVTRKKRFSYGSVIYIQEASLLADSMDYKDDEKNESLRLFNKLIAHETLGGVLVYDTQSVSDVHFAIKKNLNSYLYVHHKIRLPFFVVLYVREMMYSYDNVNIENTIKDDVEVGLRRMIVPTSVWKKFDYTCYSGLTDDLLPETAVIKGSKLKDLKCRDYLTLKKNTEDPTSVYQDFLKCEKKYFKLKEKFNDNGKKA